jgi:hypothetical protein
MKRASPTLQTPNAFRLRSVESASGLDDHDFLMLCRQAAAERWACDILHSLRSGGILRICSLHGMRRNMEGTTVAINLTTGGLMKYYVATKPRLFWTSSWLGEDRLTDLPRIPRGFLRGTARRMTRQFVGRIMHQLQQGRRSAFRASEITTGGPSPWFFNCSFSCSVCVDVDAG